MAQRDATPIPGPDAFSASGRDARLSQAAIVLSLGAAAGGQPERVDHPAEIGLPDDLAATGSRSPSRSPTRWPRYPSSSGSTSPAAAPRSHRPPAPR